MKQQEQSGRSMVEMLAVLSVIGILSIGGLAGYSLSAQRIQINNVMDVATKFSARGVGGRSFNSLAAAGIDSPNGVEMVLDESGKVCIQNFPKSNTSEKRLFAAFKAQASSYEVKGVSSVYINGTKEDCDIVLSFGKKIR